MAGEYNPRTIGPQQASSGGFFSAMFIFLFMFLFLISIGCAFWLDKTRPPSPKFRENDICVVKEGETEHLGKVFLIRLDTEGEKFVWRYTVFTPSKPPQIGSYVDADLFPAKEGSQVQFNLTESQARESRDAQFKAAVQSMEKDSVKNPMLTKPPVNENLRTLSPFDAEISGNEETP